MKFSFAEICEDVTFNWLKMSFRDDRAVANLTFNQDHGLFSCCTEGGVKIFNVQVNLVFVICLISPQFDRKFRNLGCYSLSSVAPLICSLWRKRRFCVRVRWAPFPSAKCWVVPIVWLLSPVDSNPNSPTILSLFGTTRGRISYSSLLFHPQF